MHDWVYCWTGDSHGSHDRGVPELLKGVSSEVAAAWGCFFVAEVVKLIM